MSMRSLTLIVVVLLTAFVGTANANAQEARGASERLTASIFIKAGFPSDIVQAAVQADLIADATLEARMIARVNISRMESYYDNVLRRMPQEIPVDVFIKIHNQLAKTLFELQDISRDLVRADENVNSLYFIWNTFTGFTGGDTGDGDGDLNKCKDPNAPEDTKAVFQRWYDSVRAADYIGEDSWLMLRVGYDRILAEKYFRLKELSITWRQQ